MTELGDIVVSTMTALAVLRSIFHSEADFQHALAWEIQTQHANAQIRLEQRVANDPRVELDILVALDGRSFGLELKYPRSKLEIEVDGERFVLPTGAPDLERYDVLKDVARLERLVAERVIDSGCVVVLTNASRIWLPTADSNRRTVYEAFRLHEGRVVGGAFDWSETAGAGTKIGRTEPIRLRDSYELKWRDFSRAGAAIFRYLVVSVPADRPPT